MDRVRERIYIGEWESWSHLRILPTTLLVYVIFILFFNIQPNLIINNALHVTFTFKSRAGMFR